MIKHTLLILSLLTFSLVGTAQKGTNSSLGTIQKATKKTSKAKAKPTHITTRSEELVEISTDLGNMYFRLYNQTPLHRDNFKKLIKEKFFDSLLFHRIIKGFMVQTGDPDSKNADSSKQLGNGGPGYTIPAEFVPYLFHKKGVLAAARTSDQINPNKESSGSQFYIVQGKTYGIKELENIMNSKNIAAKQQLLYKIVSVDSIQKILTGFQERGDSKGLREYIGTLQPLVDAEYNKKGIFTYSQNHIDTYEKEGGTPFLDMDYTVFAEMVSGFDVLDKIAAVETKPGDRPVKDLMMKIRLVIK